MNLVILGCGKLGQSIAEYAISKGVEVVGTVSSNNNMKSLEIKKIKSLKFTLGDQLPIEVIQNANTVLFSIPIIKSLSIETLKTTFHFIHEINPNVKFIFTSSTSVYSSDQNVTSENGKVNDENLNIVIEKIIRHQFKNYVILRLGGLISESRHPVFSLSGKKNLPNGDAPVNLVHHKDVARIVYLLMDQLNQSRVYNVVYPFHPSKAAYYTLKAKEFQLEPPTFTSDENSMHKVVSSQKAMDMLPFDFIYPI